MFNYYRFDEEWDGIVLVGLAVNEDRVLVPLWKIEKKGVDEEKVGKVIRQLVQVFEENVIPDKVVKLKKNIVVDAEKEWTYEEMLRMMKDEWGGLMK